jgi:hypothetical protein
MTDAIRTPKSRRLTTPRAQRGATAVIAQYIHDLTAISTRTPLPRPTTLGQCWGCV